MDESATAINGIKDIFCFQDFVEIRIIDKNETERLLKRILKSNGHFITGSCTNKDEENQTHFPFYRIILAAEIIIINDKVADKVADDGVDGNINKIIIRTKNANFNDLFHSFEFRVNFDPSPPPAQQEEQQHQHRRQLFGSVLREIKRIPAKIDRVANDAIDGVGDVIEDIGDVIEDIGDGTDDLLDAIGNGLNSAVDWVNKFFNRFMSNYTLLLKLLLLKLLLWREATTKLLL